METLNSSDHYLPQDPWALAFDEDEELCLIPAAWLVQHMMLSFNIVLFFCFRKNPPEENIFIEYL